MGKIDHPVIESSQQRWLMRLTVTNFLFWMLEVVEVLRLVLSSMATSLIPTDGSSVDAHNVRDGHGDGSGEGPVKQRSIKVVFDETLSDDQVNNGIRFW